MHDLGRVFLECIGEMRKAGIPVENGRVYERKAGDIEGYLGLYNDDGRHHFSIVVKEELLQDTCPLKNLKEVIIHGLIYTCPRCLGHGEKWREYAQMMDEAYGYSLLAGKEGGPISHSEKPLPKGMCAEIMGVPLNQEKRAGMTVNVYSVTSGWTK